MGQTGNAAKIAEIINKIQEYNNKITEIKEKYTTKINEYVEEAKRIQASIETKSKVWIETNLSKCTSKIEKCLEGFKKKIENILKSINEWLVETKKDLSKNIATGLNAKLGQVADGPLGVGLATALMATIPDDITTMISIPEIPMPTI